MNRKMIRYGIIGLLIFIFSNSFAHTFKGELEVLTYDFFNKNESQKKYILHEGNDIYELIIPNGKNKNSFLSGEQIIVEGVLSPSGLKQSRIKVDSIFKVDSNAPVRKQKFLNQRSILTLFVNFTDKKANAIYPKKLERQLYTSVTSVRRNYMLSSANQIKLLQHVDKAKTPSIYSVKLNYAAANACDYDKWAEDANKAAARMGINLSLYQHHMYILPEKVRCGWAGAADLGCEGSNCRSWILAKPELKFTLAHELGHNLGMDHASTDTNNDGTVELEYGDGSCFMGNFFNTGYRLLNAPLRDKLHLYSDFPNKVQTVTSSDQFTINSLDLDGSNLQILKIYRKDNKGVYYISYRTQTEPFGMAPEYAGRVNIHRAAVEGENDFHSYFIKALQEGETFADQENGISVTAINAHENNSSIVEVVVNPE